jgi:type IV secretory pathway TraG/TraD family ATPase VirD4
MKNKFTAWHHRKRNKKIIIFNPVNKNIERWNPKKKKEKKRVLINKALVKPSEIVKTCE